MKCFDKCSFDILHGSLEYFKFGEIVKMWTKILYKDFTVQIQNNGYFSDIIEINKGVHQGGCCSSVYFLVIAEILAIALRSNEDIEGITIQDIRALLNQFADDMDIFSNCTEKSIKTIYEELEKFRLQSGFTVSYEKTTLYRIGSLRNSNAQMYNMTEFVWSNEDISVLGVTIAHEDIVNKNYLPLISKVRSVLNAWHNRNLSLVGKVQVVNALVASLFVYKMMVLPIIPPRIVKTIDNQIREFIWNGKKSKIAYKVLQNPKQEGGLNLVNLQNKDKALKATWPQILDQEQEYACIVYKQMRCAALGGDIWRCRLQKQDVDKLKISNEFWQDVLKSWSEFNYHYNFRVENQIIWYNSSIVIQGKPFMWKDVLQRGLKYIEQLFRNQQYKSEQEVEQEYGLTVLRYNCLKAAIPKEWKEFFVKTPREKYYPLPPHNYDQCINFVWINFSRKVYKFLSDDIMLLHNKYVKWRMDLGQELCESLYDFGSTFIELYRITNIAKYRSFQYRLLQRAIVTNIDLFKWGIKSSQSCSYCSIENESIVHLFSECHVVRDLWWAWRDYVMERFKLEEIDISTKAIILNQVVTNNRKKQVINFLCLVVKQYIYAQKCLGENIHFPALRAKIKHIENVEKYIALKNGKEVLHAKKWK